MDRHERKRPLSAAGAGRMVFPGRSPARKPGGIGSAKTRGRSAGRTAVFLCVFLLCAGLFAGCGGRKERGTGGGGAESGKDSGDRASNRTETDSGSGAEETQEAAESLPDEAQSENGPGSAQTADQAPGASRQVCHVGESLQDGDLRIVYTASGIHREESRDLQPETGQKYIFLQFCFENMSEERDCAVSLLSFRCFADGKDAQPWFGSDQNLSAVLTPGRMSSGSVCFSVPEDSGEIDIEYQSRAESGGPLHFLYEGEQDAGYALPVRTERTAGAHAPGDVFEEDGLRITYHSCAPDDSDNAFVQPAEGCSFHTVSLTVENLGKTDLEASFYDFQCFADGLQCGTVLFRDDVLSETVPPGGRAEGTVTFEVPDTAGTVEAEYTCYERSAGQIVFTLR